MALTFDTPAQVQGVGCLATMPINITLIYDSEDPLVFGIKFHSSKYNDEVLWIASMDLLRDGLNGPSGLADVQIWPETPDRKKHRLAIRLESEAGESVTWIPMQVATDFVNAVDEEEDMAAVSAERVIELSIEDFLEELGLYPYDFVPNPGGPSQPQGWCNNCGRVHSGNGCGDH